MTTDIDTILADYRAKRDAYIRAADAADRAFIRRFTGQTVNGAAAARLANTANYLSADYASAQGAVWSAGIDSQAIDKADGIDPLPVI